MQKDLRRDARRIPIMLAGANCTGMEQALTECSGPPGEGVSSTVPCSFRDVVSLTCFSDSLMDTGAGRKYCLNNCE